MSEIILDSVIDSIKLLPFLFLTYLFMEWLEHKTGAAARKRIRKAGKFGPVWGGLLGVIPQCGFSAAASSLFAGRVITVGTLIAVYLSTSDEMFPIMISNAVPVVTIVKILTCKAVIGILSGLVLEYVYTHILKKQEPDVDIHEICEEERCHCEHGVISSAAFHTLKVFVYIFLISLALNIIIGLAALVLILIILMIINVVQMSKLKKSYKIFMKGKNAKNLEDTLIKRLNQVDDLINANSANEKNIKTLFQNMQRTYQKMGLVKYDAFNEMGGKLSFSLAMLDVKNNGFIINAMHTREGCYTYIKEIIDGNSVIVLSGEEQEALNNAMGENSIAK